MSEGTMMLSTTTEKVETCEADLAKMIANFRQTLSDAGIVMGEAHDLTMVFAKEIFPALGREVRRSADHAGTAGHVSHGSAAIHA